jgi:iron complex outermembrane receptor protein
MTSPELIPSHCFWLSLLSLSPSLHAQTPGSNTYPPVQVVDSHLEFRQFEKVEITGSAILAKEAKEALPVQVITQREIERTGSTNLTELLQQLPLMNNFAENGTLATGAGGPQSAAIHGYASGTLVLLNGRRLPYYGNNTIAGERAYVDLNILPLSAIERIEILIDGASTRYGSDAMAGVINIITKSSVQGTTISTQLTQPAGGKAVGEQMNLSWGKGKTEIDGFSVQLHLSLEKQKPLYAGDRMASKEAAYVMDVNGQKLWSLGKNLSLHGWPTNIMTPEGITTHPVLSQTGRCPDQWYGLSNGQYAECYRNAQTALTLYPGLDKKQIFASGEVQLDNNWRAFGQLLLGEYVQSFVSKDSYDLRIPLSDGNYALFTSQPLGPITQAYTNKSYQATLGLRGQIEDWDVVASLSNGEHRVVREYTSGIVRAAQWRAIQKSGLTLEDFSQDYRQLSDSTWARFSPHQQKENLLLDDANTHLNALDLLASKELANTDHGPIALGLGLNWRRESISNFVNPLINTTQRPDFTAQRSSTAVYGELQLPVSARSELTASLRQDQYSDFGQVQTGKLGWRWRPASDLMFRASIGTGFRAPTLAQMMPLSTRLGYVLDQISDTYIQVKTYGNPDLKPERSIQSSVGVRWEPNPTWTLGADLWQLQLKDTFGNLTAESILSDPLLRAQFLVEGPDSYLKSLNKNLGHAIYQGIDYDAQWRHPTDFGRLRLNLKGTWNLTSKSQSAPNGDYQSDLGQFNPNSYTVTPKHQFMMSLGLEQSNWSIFSAVNYRSGNKETVSLLNLVTGEYTDIERKVPAYWTLNLGARWQTHRQWTLSGLIANLTDKTPPLRLISTGIINGVDTRYANYYGRTLKLKAEYKF